MSGDPDGWLKENTIYLGMQGGKAAKYWGHPFPNQVDSATMKKDIEAHFNPNIPADEQTGEATKSVLPDYNTLGK